MYPSHLSRATAIFVVDWCQFGPSWILGLIMELMVCANLVGGIKEQSCIFPDLIWYYKWYEIPLIFLHHTSAVLQLFLLLIATKLALAGLLGWKWSLWSVPTWLEVQRSKAVFSLTLYDIFNDMKYFWKCLHYTSAVPQPFLLLIAANLAQAWFLGWTWSLWPIPDWLVLQRSIAVFLLT